MNEEKSSCPGRFSMVYDIEKTDGSLVYLNKNVKK
jgi:hypothetical protein